LGGEGGVGWRRNEIVRREQGEGEDKGKRKKRVWKKRKENAF
jgi:hypothetical protein